MAAEKAVVLEEIELAVAVKPGEETTEYKEARSGALWGKIGQGIGFTLSTLSTIGMSLGVDTKAALYVGLAITIIGCIQTTLTQLGYINARATTKAAASMGPFVN